MYMYMYMYVYIYIYIYTCIGCARCRDVLRDARQHQRLSELHRRFFAKEAFRTTQSSSGCTEPQGIGSLL